MMRSEIQNDAAEARENDEEELLVCFQNQKGLVQSLSCFEF
jgi:hypothetical protein